LQLAFQFASGIDIIPRPSALAILDLTSTFIGFCLEVVSKSQIRFKGKAQADRESAAYMGM
jgi:hypothetical protein